MTITATDLSGTNVTNGSVVPNGNLTFTFTASEPTTNFALGDISVSGGSLSNFVATSSTVYTATFTPSNSGPYAVGIGSQVFSDVAGNVTQGTDSHSLYFDGSDDKVTTTFSSNKLSSDFSIGIWFKSNGINNANVFDMILDYSNTEFLEFFLEGGGGCSACATGTFVGSVNEGGSNSTLNYTTKSTTRG